MDKQSVVIPRYQQIAIDLAHKIAKGEYRQGQKIYARSAIASQYNVSPETARRAICVLVDLDIVSSELGSGVVIKSVENAGLFVASYSQRETIDIIQKRIRKDISHQKTIFESIQKGLYDLMDATEQLKATNPLTPFQLEITADCIHLGKTCAELQFWQHTGSTIIAIRKKDTLVKSPGPYTDLEIGDVIYFISQDDTIRRTKDFLYGKKAN